MIPNFKEMMTIIASSYYLETNIIKHIEMLFKKSYKRELWKIIFEENKYKEIKIYFNVDVNNECFIHADK